MKNDYFARKNGRHYHISRKCMFVDCDYRKVTIKEIVKKNLYLCPYCMGA